MFKGLASFVLLVVVLGVSAQACGGPPADQPTQNLPDAQATDVRRTAVGNVQRIIANNPAATATPAATALPQPSCQGAIWWHEASSHIGELRKVQGTIVATRPAADGLTMIEIGQPYPDPTGLAVLVPAATLTTPALDGKTVCVAGRIINSEGRATISLQNAATIALVN